MASVGFGQSCDTTALSLVVDIQITHAVVHRIAHFAGVLTILATGFMTGHFLLLGCTT